MIKKNFGITRPKTPRKFTASRFIASILRQIFFNLAMKFALKMIRYDGIIKLKAGYKVYKRSQAIAQKLFIDLRANKKH